VSHPDVEAAAVGFDIGVTGGHPRRRLAVEADHHRRHRWRLAVSTRTMEAPMNTTETPTGKGIRRATGRGYDEWFAALDEWGAVGRPYREIADWLTGEHAMSAWWAQKLIVEYEQARGVRQAGARPDGTFAAGASKTIAAPVEQAAAAFTDPGLRSRWLPGVSLAERTSQRGRSIRLDVGDGTRLNVTFGGGPEKTQVAVEQERLADAAAAEAARAFWRDRLAALKSLLEA
jgi:uncharacterized protein YndB with AHSA1/START domain